MRARSWKKGRRERNGEKRHQCQHEAELVDAGNSSQEVLEQSPECQCTNAAQKQSGNAHSAPRATTSERILAGLALNASRTPISCLRCVTAYDMAP
jgi:hypothetical protein